MTYKYKLTDQDMKTHNGFQWKLNKWVKTSGEGYLCHDGWLHCYDDPLLAVLHNPIHADIENPRLFRCEVKGKTKRKGQMKCGWSEMRLVEELEVPKITTEKRVKYAIYCALEVYKDEEFRVWAENWLSGKDRSKEAARAAAKATEVAWTVAWAATEVAWTAAWAVARAAALAVALVAREKRIINLKKLAKKACR